MFQQIRTAEVQVDTITQTVINVPNASTTVLAANPERKYMKFRSQGTGTAALYLRFSATVATATNSLELLDAEEYEEGISIVGGMIYTGEVRAITSAGSKELYVEERS